MPPRSPIAKSVPLKMVGSTVFGRYPKISVEQTWNMIISDAFLVPYAGYKKTTEIFETGQGRGIFNSSRAGKLIMVVNDTVFTINDRLTATKVATIDTANGDVFMDENDADQIAISDGQDIYIYNHSSGDFQKAAIDFLPGYITFQDGYFISPDTKNPKWRLSTLNEGLSWPIENEGTFQTKPDNVVACVRLPGRGNQLLVMGKTVTEAWTDVGAQLFPYQRSSSYNIDYGCLNAGTIATGDKFIIWLGVNEKSGAAILVNSGGDTQQLSNDGINFKLSQLSRPDKAYGFLFKQDGHLFYQLTFYDSTDNLTIVYDFNTNKFFFLCDGCMNYHIAKKIAYFEGTYYFISFNDGHLYEMNSKYTDFDGGEIPRIRIPNNTRFPNTSPFVIESLVFPIEQGASETIQRVDVSISKDGGDGFSNSYPMTLRPIGKRKNEFIVWRLGLANDFVPQFRFWGKSRFLASDGVINIYQ